MTASPDGIRRLKAIMFTDIKGYSAMMGADEARTVKLVLEHRAIVRECLGRHDGEERETIGDAFVVLFDSVVNAVRCAAEIQERLRQRNATLPVEDQVWLRIGIHLGDIILQNDGIYGDGVNLAARIESKADPGGICITEQVYLQIDGKFDFPVEAMGKVELKNIRNPPPLYRLKLDGVVPGRKARRWLPAAVGLLLLVAGGAGAAVMLGPDATAPAPAPVPVAVAAPAPVPAPVPPPAPAPVAATRAQPDPAADARRAEVARAVDKAMAAQGADKVYLLQEALRLDPENAALRALLEAARTAAAQPPAPPPTAAAGVAARPRPGADKPAPRPAEPAARSAHDQRAPADSPRIRPTIVEE